MPFYNGLASRWFCLTTGLANRFKANSGRRPEVYLRAGLLNDRHLYLLAEFFVQAGYYVNIVGSIRKEQYYNHDPYYFYIFSSDRIRHVKELGPGIGADALFCTDGPVEQGEASRFSKVIQVRYDMDVPPGGAVDAPFLPYPMHPNVYHAGQVRTIPALRESPKKMGLFFAGNLKDQYAASSRLLRHGLTRAEGVAFVQRRFAGRVRLFTTRRALLHGLENEDLTRSIVVFDATTERLGREEWFPVLAQSRFFLALPGVVMPMCHNSVEAMALGVPPILSYGQLFTPPLPAGSVCLAYVTEADLGRAVEQALAMEDASYARLRRQTLEHFDRHMTPAAFLQRLLRDSGRTVSVRFPAEFVSEALARDQPATV